MLYSNCVWRLFEPRNEQDQRSVLPAGHDPAPFTFQPWSENMSVTTSKNNGGPATPITGQKAHEIRSMAI